MEQNEKIKMAADAFKSTYEAADAAYVGYEKLANYAKLLGITSAAILNSLTELEEALPHISDLFSRIADKEEQVNDLLEKMTWIKTVSQKKEETADKQESVD